MNPSGDRGGEHREGRAKRGQNLVDPRQFDQRQDRRVVRGPLEIAARGRERARLRCSLPALKFLAGENGLKRRPHGALGVVLLGVRIAEQGHQPVAELLQDMAPKIGHRSRSLIEIGVDEVAPILGVQLRG
jgi:hypothetical protein